MGTIADRIRARLSAASSRRGISNGQSSSSESADSDSNILSDNSVYLSVPVDYESAKAHLRLASILYLRASTQCYINYASAGVAVYDTLLGGGKKWFQNYCLEPYPDVCCCGHVLVSNAGAIRSHCPVCKGKSLSKLGYDIQVLTSKVGIHYSWLEYGLAYGIQKVGPAQKWRGTHYEDSQ